MSNIRDHPEYIPLSASDWTPVSDMITGCIAQTVERLNIPKLEEAMFRSGYLFGLCHLFVDDSFPFYEDLDEKALPVTLKKISEENGILDGDILIDWSYGTDCSDSRYGKIRWSLFTQDLSLREPLDDIVLASLEQEFLILISHHNDVCYINLQDVNHAKIDEKARSLIENYRGKQSHFSIEDVVESRKGNFSVIIKDLGPNGFEVMQNLRRINGVSLSEAKQIVETSPAVVRDGLSQAWANTIAESFAGLGATITIEE